MLLKLSCSFAILKECKFCPFRADPGVAKPQASSSSKILAPGCLVTFTQTRLEAAYALARLKVAYMHYVKQGLFEMHNGIFQVPYFYQVYDPKGQRKVNTNIIIQSQTPDQLYVYA